MGSVGAERQGGVAAQIWGRLLQRFCKILLCLTAPGVVVLSNRQFSVPVQLVSAVGFQSKSYSVWSVSVLVIRRLLVLICAWQSSQIVVGSLTQKCQGCPVDADLVLRPQASHLYACAYIFKKISTA